MELLNMYAQLGLSPTVYQYGEAVLESLKDRFAAIDQTAEYNQCKVIHAMQKNREGVMDVIKLTEKRNVYLSSEGRAELEFWHS